MCLLLPGDMCTWQNSFLPPPCLALVSFPPPFPALGKNALLFFSFAPPRILVTPSPGVSTPQASPAHSFPFFLPLNFVDRVPCSPTLRKAFSTCRLHLRVVGMGMGMPPPPREQSGAGREGTQWERSLDSQAERSPSGSGREVRGVRVVERPCAQW